MSAMTQLTFLSGSGIILGWCGCMKEEFLAKLDIDGDGKEFFQENDFFLKFCNYGFKEKHFDLSAT